MLKNLRRRLTIILTALTGAVLAAILSVSLFMSIQQARGENDRSFASYLEELVASLQVAQLSGSKEATLVEKSPYFVSIESEDLSVSVSAGTQPQADLDDLFAQASAAVTKAGLNEVVTDTYYYEGGIQITDTETEADSVAIAVVSNIMSADGNMGIETDSMLTIQDDQGGAYRAASFFVMLTQSREEAGSMQWQMVEYKVVGLADLSGLYKDIAILYIIYIALFLTGVGLLWLASWQLAGLVMRPTVEGMRRQTEFMAAASHELRTPLAVVQSSLSAADAAAGEEEAKKYRQSAQEEIQRMNRLVNDMLLLARGDAGNWKIAESEVDIDTLLIEANEQFLPVAKKQGNRLVLDLPEKTLPTVQGDKSRLHQILSVLLDNALQYAPPGTEIILAARQRKQKIEIDVMDHGPGVAGDDKEKIFDRFYRADESRSDENHFGLGLSVARELAGLHKGTLTVHDTKEGGATFRLTLPLPRAGGPPPARPL